jgi:hypothetical protein
MLGGESASGKYIYHMITIFLQCIIICISFNYILQLKSRHGALDKVIYREPERSVLLVREHRIADKLL